MKTAKEQIVVLDIIRQEGTRLSRGRAVLSDPMPPHSHSAGKKQDKAPRPLKSCIFYAQNE
jgi:hypothetical protein